MRMILALCLFELFFWTCAAFASETNSAIPVMAASRWIKSETATEQVWIDKMTDGTFRESIVKKPPTVIRTTLIATNDVDFAYRFDYASVLSDGTVVTNAAFKIKPKKEQLNQKIAAMKHTPPMPPTNVAEQVESMAKVAVKIKSQAAGAMAQAVVVRKRLENKRPVSMMNSGNGKSVMTFADGRTEIADVKRVVSARRPSPYEKKEVPEPTGKSATFLLGFAAGVAAMGGAVAVKKGKG